MALPARSAARLVARRRRFAAGFCLLAAAGCNANRVLTTYRPGDRPLTLAARPAAVEAGDAPFAVGPQSSRRDAAVRPAAFSPQEFGAGGEGGGLDPSAAPTAGPLETGTGDAPTAGPLQTDTGDAPTAGPLDPGEGDAATTGGDVGQEGGDLGSAPGTGLGDGGLGGAGLGGGTDTPGVGTDRGIGEGPNFGGSTSLLPGGSDAELGGGGEDDVADLDRPSETSGPTLSLGDVTGSVLLTYPLLAEAAANRPLADGFRLEAAGEFDTKLKAAQELSPVGFYENYRHGAGVEQPLIGGADLFAGYRIGRGTFEPWYQERQTNDGGEFKAGFTVPLLQDRRIDDRRARLQIASLERAAAEPTVALAQLDAVRDASGAYWEWVAAGRLLDVAERLLSLSLDRTEGLNFQVEQGEVAEIVLADNDRLIAARRSKVIDAERKFRQSAAKLSLYLRSPDGVPLVPEDDLLPSRFPEPVTLFGTDSTPPPGVLMRDAVARRPELLSLELARQQTAVSLAEARNDLLPELDAGVVVSQDVGQLSSSKGDKQPFELDTALTFSVPLQRRKARGKAQQLEAKLAMLSAKRRFTADKVGVQVRLALAALEAARDQIEQAVISADLAERLREAEVDAFGLGESDLLRLNLREASAASAAESLVAARFAFWVAAADLAYAIAAPPTLPDADDPLDPVAPPPPAPLPAPMPLPQN